MSFQFPPIVNAKWKLSEQILIQYGFQSFHIGKLLQNNDVSILGNSQSLTQQRFPGKVSSFPCGPGNHWKPGNIKKISEDNIRKLANRIHDKWDMLFSEKEPPASELEKIISDVFIKPQTAMDF